MSYNPPPQSPIPADSLPVAGVDPVAPKPLVYRLPSPTVATVCFLVAMVLFNLLALFGRRIFGLSSIWVTFIGEIILVAALPLIFCKVLKYDFKQVFSHQPLQLGTLALCALVGLIAQFAVRLPSFVSNWLLQIFGPLYLPDQLEDGTPVGKWLLALVALVLAPLCEEILNRGFVMAGYRRFGYWRCIMIVGLFFGLFHQYPYRLLDTAIAGMILAYLTLTTGSIYASMAAHFGFNLLPTIVNFFREAINQALRDSNYEYSNSDILIITGDQIVASIILSLISAALLFLLLRVITLSTARVRPGLVVNYNGLALDFVDSRDGVTNAENGSYYGPANQPYRYASFGYQPVPLPFPTHLRPVQAVEIPSPRVGWVIAFVLILVLFAFTSYTEIMLRAEGRNICSRTPRICVTQVIPQSSNSRYVTNLIYPGLSIKIFP
ncbi:MAG: type II CAAX endopeptidase family protein [Chloroflexota bacterium]